MPTALDAGRYSSNGFQVSCQRQDVRATGLPAPSTWASAARNAGVMTAVEWPRKTGSYCRRLGRRLGERAAHREEQLGRLADDLVAPVGSGPERQDARHAGDDAEATPAPPPRPFRTQDQSAYTPVFLMIGPHLSISDLSRMRSDSGVALPVATGSAPRSASRALNAASVTAVCSAPTSLSSAALGVPLGANSPFQTTSAKPFRPSSSRVGTSGSEGTRIFEVTP